MECGGNVGGPISLSKNKDKSQDIFNGPLANWHGTLNNSESQGTPGRSPFSRKLCAVLSSVAVENGGHPENLAWV